MSPPQIFLSFLHQNGLTLIQCGEDPLFWIQYLSLASTIGMQSIVTLHHNGFENCDLYDDGSGTQKAAQDQASL